MATESEVSGHYGSGDLLARLGAALRDDGVDPERPSIAALAPYDQFHGRGLEATEELAGLLQVAPTDHILDVGSGIGGPARYLAHRFGCRVTGLDLTASSASSPAASPDCSACPSGSSSSRATRSPCPSPTRASRAPTP